MQAIILARVSSKEQEHTNSIPAQVRRLTEYADRQNLKVIQVVRLVESSTKGTRVEFNKIIGQIKKYKEPTALLVDTIDRLQRGFSESDTLNALRKDGKLTLHFLRENLILNEKSNSSELFRWNIGVATVQNYVDSSRDNINRGIAEKTRRGEWSSKAPFGYSNTRQGIKPWVEPNQDAPIVKQIFNLYSTGAYSMRGLTNSINEQFETDIKTPLVHRILNNPFYYGKMRKKGQLYPHIYETIISREVFDTAQRVSERFNKPAFKYAGLDYVYRGLIICKDCGCRITVEKAKERYIYYHCTQFKKKHHAPYLREENIDDQLQKAISAIHLTEEEYNKVVSELKNIHGEQSAINNNIRSRTNAELTKITSRIDRLLDIYADGELSKEEYKKKREKYNDQKEKLESRLTRIDTAPNEWFSNATTILGLLKKAPLLFAKSSKIDKKRHLLKLLFQNFWIQDSQLGWEYRKPFDFLSKNKNCLNWCWK